MRCKSLHPREGLLVSIETRRRRAKLAAATRNAVVAFQLDHFDTTTRSGWSVLGVGEAYEVVDPARLAELEDLQPDPWVRDRDAHVLCIPLSILTGRRVTAGAEHDAAQF